MTQASTDPRSSPDICRREVDRNDIAIAQAISFQGPHYQIVDVRSVVVEGDAFPLEVDYGFNGALF
jgi:hypothetical protein